MNIIAIANRKGGVAKTTTAINFSYGLGLKRYRVLLVDLDPMRGLTQNLGLADDFGIEDYLEERRALKDCIFKGDKIDVLPAGPGLALLEERLYKNIPGSFTYLKDHLKNISGYNYLIIDTGPALSALMVNALVYSDNVIIPVKCDYASLEGLATMIGDIEQVKQSGLNRNLKLLAIVPTFYSARLSICNFAIEKLIEKFHKIITKTYIRNVTALAEAPAFSKSIFSYRASSYGAQDYEKLSSEIIKRLKRG